MNEENKTQIKKNFSNLSYTNINFHKINSIMNKRLDDVLDYLTASVYFERYNDKQNRNKKNLEKFFKSSIFSKKPFLTKNAYKLNNPKNNLKKQNKQLNIIVNFRNNQLNIQKNKFTSPFILHSKKTHFLKNMIDFSKHIHSEEKKENDIKKHPELISKSLNPSDLNDFSENPNILTPKNNRYNLDFFTKRYGKFFAKNNFNNRKLNNLFEMNSDNFSSINDNDKINLSDINRIRTAKSFISFDKNKEKEFINWKKRLRSKKRNIFQNYLNVSPNSNLNSNLSWNNFNKNKTPKKIKLFKANCYYNNLHLLKLGKILKKNSYQNIN